jgi:outer membrane protein assembly factor BamB
MSQRACLRRKLRPGFSPAFLGLLFLAFSPTILSAQWPMHGYNARRTGYSSSPGPITGEVKWTYDFGGTLQDNASPIIGPDHTIYQITNIYPEGLFALNPNGTLKWKYPASGRLAPALSPDGSAIYSTLSYNSIVAIKTSDGSKLWDFTFPQSQSGEDHSYASLAVDAQGIIYVCTRLPASVHALKPDGTLKWSYIHPNSEHLGIEAPPAVGPDGSVYVYVNVVGLVALDGNGVFKWSDDANLGSYGWPTLSVLPDGTIISAGDAYRTEIIAYNPDGSIKWRSPNVGLPGDYFPGVAVSQDGKTIYTGREAGKVFALDAQTGKTIWSSVVTSGENLNASPALASNGIIYIMGTNGHIYAVLEIDGTLLWQHEINSPHWFWGPQSPALDSDGTLYAVAPGSTPANGGLSSRLYAFKFTANQPPYVSITSPGANSVYKAGTTLTIYAEAGDSDGTVQKVEFLADGLKLGEDADGSNGFSFVWNNIPPGDHDLNARAADNYGIKSPSPAVRITVTSPFAVISPNGGESWNAGSIHAITWTTEGSIANVKIEYSTDGGSNWASIISSTPNSGSYSWTVPDVSSTTCSVRVSDVGNAVLYDRSDLWFTLIAAPPTITISAPSGGESWLMGSRHTLMWTSSKLTGDVSIDLYKGGSFSRNIGTDTATSLFYWWTIPTDLQTGNDYKIRVSQGTTEDYSDGFITIYQLSLPTVTTAAVTSITATFAVSGGSVVSDGYSSVTDKGICLGLSPNPTKADSWVSAGWGNESFVNNLTGLTPHTIYHVRAYATNSVGTSYGDDIQFETLFVQSLTVSSPNGGEKWEIGSKRNIVWAATGGVGDVKIEYSTNAGATYALIVAATPNEGSFSWTIPNTPSTRCFVRITQVAGGNPADTSDAAFVILPSQPTIGLSKSSLRFGAQAGMATQGQAVVITNVGTAGSVLHWTATPSPSWLTVSQSSGTGGGTVTIGVNTSGLGAGAYTGSVSISDPNATNSPQAVAVNLKVYPSGGSQPPFGSFDSPIDGTTGVTGAIPVTGWVLDDIETTKVEIWRDPVLSAGEVNSPYFIGTAIFVEGARPDIEIAYPIYPLSSKAGWGYMLLTNFLPGQGNGTFKLYAIATDKEGNVFTLGTKTIVCDNAHAVKPFGTIDTPAQGGDASGNPFLNFGWVLTPQPKTVPKNGTTITVYVDSVPVGNLSTAPNVYDQYRSDVSGNFPGLKNTGGPGAGGPVGAFFLDTTKYTNGVHTIYWVAYDDAVQGDGIGSRYFNIVNTGTAPEKESGESLSSHPAFPKIGTLKNMPKRRDPIRVETGFNRNAYPATMAPDRDGLYRVQIPEVSRLEINLTNERDLAGAQSGSSRYSGYLAVGDELRGLPIGSTLDPLTGRFSWAPGPGFLGSYDLVFVESAGANPSRSYRVGIEITSKR